MVEKTYYCRKYLYLNKQNVGRNISVKGVSGDGVCPTLVWKTESVSDGYSAEENSEQNIEYVI